MKHRSGRLRVALVVTGATVLATVGQAPAWSADGAAAATGGAGANAVVADWHLESPRRSPSVAERAAMTFDEGRGEVVMFGGTPRDLVGSNETWTWDGKTWDRLQTNRPPLERMDMALAYDPVRDEIIMFGGYNQYEGFLGDTWVLKGSDWTRLRPTNSPSERGGATMAYDPHLGQLVMFGGCCNITNETWTWDGSNWQQLHPAASPLPRQYAGLAYDPSRDALVLFGGNKITSEGFEDTWRWDGATWIEETPSRSPSTYQKSGMATFGRHVMVFGGSKGKTWVLKDNGWRRQRDEPAPPPRPWGELVWDPLRRQAVLYGEPYSTDTWTAHPDHVQSSLDVKIL